MPFRVGNGTLPGRMTGKGTEYAVMWLISLLFMNICLKNLRLFIIEANFEATNI